jgi:hypothetical protein
MTLMEDGQSIGRIMEQRELLPGRKWAWYLQITGAHRAGVDTWGYAASLEDAKTAFHASLEGYRAAEQKASDEHFLGLGARNRSLFCVGAVGTFTFARSDDPRLRNSLAAATFFWPLPGRITSTLGGR